MHKAEIITGDDGIAIVTASETDAVSLDEVSAVVAYKIDELTTDLVCCDIVTGAGEERQVRTIHEEVPGFEAAMTCLGTLASFNQLWRDLVELPAFAANRTILYSRVDAAG